MYLKQACALETYSQVTVKDLLEFEDKHLLSASRKKPTIEKKLNSIPKRLADLIADKKKSLDKRYSYQNIGKYLSDLFFYPRIPEHLVTRGPQKRTNSLRIFYRSLAFHLNIFFAAYPECAKLNSDGEMKEEKGDSLDKIKKSFIKNVIKGVKVKKEDGQGRTHDEVDGAWEDHVEVENTLNEVDKLLVKFNNRYTTAGLFKDRRSAEGARSSVESLGVPTPPQFSEEGEQESSASQASGPNFN